MIGEVIIVGVVVFGLYSAYRQRQKALEAWRAAAATLVGQFSEGTHPRIAGRYDGRWYTVEVFTKGSGKNKSTWTRLVVTAPDAARGLTVRSENAWTKFKQALGGTDVKVHDPEFDARVHLSGDPGQVAALLTNEVRATLRGLVETHEATLEGGDLKVEKRGIVDSEATIVNLVHTLARAANQLELGAGERATRLAHNALRDPLAAVRVNNLEVLAAEHARSPATRLAALEALKDPDAAVRLAGARAAGGPEALETLRSVAENPGDPDARLSALHALLDGYAYAEVVDAIDGVLRSGRPPLRALAVRAIGEERDLSRFHAVVKAASLGDEGLAKAAAVALGQLGDARAEEALVKLLAFESDEVRAEAAKALGRVGTVAAVEPLLPLTKGLLESGTVKEQARSAVREIQARLGPVEAGRISLALTDDTAGALSVAGEGGELSVADEAGEEPRRSPWTKDRG